MSPEKKDETMTNEEMKTSLPNEALDLFQRIFNFDDLVYSEELSIEGHQVFISTEGTEVSFDGENMEETEEIAFFVGDEEILFSQNSEDATEVQSFLFLKNRLLQGIKNAKRNAETVAPDNAEEK